MYRFQFEWERWKKPEGWISKDRREFSRMVDRANGRWLVQAIGLSLMLVGLWIFFLKWINP
jgi:hypothetical protein